MTLEGALGLLAGLEANSISVLTWAASSAVEGLASAIVIWRFTGSRTLSEHSLTEDVDEHGDGQHRPAAAEHPEAQSDREAERESGQSHVGYRLTGSRARFQAIIPPRRLTASYPAFMAMAVARELRAPEWHKNAIGRSASSSCSRLRSCLRGTLTAPRTEPVRSSEGCRTSTSCSSRWARRAEASSGAIDGLRVKNLIMLSSGGSRDGVSDTINHR